jgi:hypothetical protein
MLSWALPGLQAGQTPQRRFIVYSLVPGCRGASREQSREHGGFDPVRSRMPSAFRSFRPSLRVIVLTSQVSDVNRLLQAAGSEALGRSDDPYLRPVI